VVSGTDIKVSQIASEYEHLGVTPDDIVEARLTRSIFRSHARSWFQLGTVRDVASAPRVRA
jgi:hypothetical protein